MTFLIHWTDLGQKPKICSNLHTFDRFIAQLPQNPDVYVVWRPESHRNVFAERLLPSQLKLLKKIAYMDGEKPELETALLDINIQEWVETNPTKRGKRPW